MRRGGVVTTMIAAVVVGLLAGVVLFTQVGPVPLAIGRPTGGPSGPSSTAAPSPSASPSAAAPTPSTSSPTPTPSTSAPSSPEPSAPTPSDPAFTVRALLQPEEFQTVGGWGTTSLVDSWQGLPPEQVTSCTEPAGADGERVATHSAVYRGRSTTGAEVVIRYADADAAEVAVSRMIERITACADQPDGDPELTVTDLPAPDPEELSEVYLWDTTAVVKKGTAQGAIGIARAGDRIAFLTLISLSTDPVGGKKKATTDLDALLLQAGRRLI